MFGLLTVAVLFKIYEAGRDLIIAIHFYLAYGGAALIGLHLTIFLKHNLINKDKMLRCMLRLDKKPLSL